MTGLPNPFESGAQTFPPDEAVASNPSQAQGAAEFMESSSMAELSAHNRLGAGSIPASPTISPAGISSALPSGECDPSVTSDYAAGESKQRLLAAIEDDYRFVFDEKHFEAALYAPPYIRGESFEQHIAKLDDLIGEQPMPMFMQRTA